MKQQVNELAGILGKELSLHEQLVASSNEMNAALRDRRTGDVARCNSRYDALSCEIEALEEKRIEASDRLAASIGCTCRRATIQKIIALLPSNEAAVLSDLRCRLKTQISELHRLNSANRIYLVHRLRFIEKTFEIIANNLRRPTGYQAQGTQARTSINLAVVNRVA